jgi:hypothetical protein
VIAVPKDLVHNKDFSGHKVVKGDFPENFARAIEYGLESANLISGAVLADIRTGEGNPLTDTISQIGGVNYTERSPSDKLDEVGVDVAVGTWRSADSVTTCYWSRLAGFSGELRDVVANGFSDGATA